MIECSSSMPLASGPSTANAPGAVVTWGGRGVGTKPSFVTEAATAEA
jgi:hypothetical protein